MQPAINIRASQVGQDKPTPRRRLEWGHVTRRRHATKQPDASKATKARKQASLRLRKEKAKASDARLATALQDQERELSLSLSDPESTLLEH